MNSLWIDKHIPQNINEIKNNDENIEKIKNWLNIFKTRKSEEYKNNWSNGLFIWGALSTGKKNCVKILLKDLGFQIKNVEFNPNLSLKNQFDSIQFLSNNKIFNNKKHIAVLVSDIDYIISSTKSSVKYLTDYLSQNEINRCPVIFISNGIDSSNKNLSKVCIEIKFNPPNDKNIEEFIIKIKNSEKINIKLPIPKNLITICQNDYRRTLYILENIKLYYKDKELNKEDYKAICDIFITKDISLDLNNSYNSIMKDPLDIDTINFYYTQNMPKLPFLVHENIVKNINKNSLSSSDKNLTIVKKYYENLCDAYKIQTKILSNNNWDLSEYVGILSCYSANLIMNESMKSKKNRFRSITYF